MDIFLLWNAAGSLRYLNSEMLHIHLAALWQVLPISIVVVKARGDWCNLPEETKEDKEKNQEATASLAAAKDLSVDVPVMTVLSELSDVFILKEEQKHKDVTESFSPLLTYFRKREVISQHATGRRYTSCTPLNNGKSQIVATRLNWQ